MLSGGPDPSRSAARAGPRATRARGGIILPMTPARAELSSIAATLGELTRRVSSLAEEAERAATGGGASGPSGATGADLATELFHVERSLRGALRRLERAAGGGRA